MAGIPWTEKEKQDLISYVETGNYSYRQLSKILNRTKDSLQLKAREMGLNNKYIHHLYTYDINYFKVPNYRNSYWAGWLAADGSIGKYNTTNYVLRWRMNIIDLKKLEEFKNDIKFNGPIRFIKNISSYSGNVSDHVTLDVGRIDIESSGLINNFGIEPNKTYRLQKPSIKEKELQLAFLIGYINGDGCIHFQQKTKNIIIKFTSSSVIMLQWIKDLIEKLGLPRKTSRIKNIRKISHANCYEYSISGLSAIYLFELLKQVPVPVLDRKWNNPIVLNGISEIKAKHPEWFTESIKSIMENNNIDFSRKFV